MYKLKKNVGSNIFSAQLFKIISHYKKIGKFKKWNVHGIMNTSGLFQSYKLGIKTVFAQLEVFFSSDYL